MDIKLLAVIPARGGSKGIHRKNMTLLNGRPLIDYTLDAAMNCCCIDRVLVSTDDAEIVEYAEKKGAWVPFVRPRELALDDTPILPVLKHLLDELSSNHNYNPDAIVLLQPTSPLRTANHIREACHAYLSQIIDTLVSVVKVPHQFSPNSIYIQKEDKLLTVYNDENKLIFRRQDKPVYWARNGPAILITSKNTLCNKGLYGNILLGYEMDYLDSFDVDEISDLELIEALMKFNIKKKNQIKRVKKI